MLIKNLWDAFHEGKQLANPKLWKERTQLLNKLVIFITLCLAISKGFGYDFSIGQADVELVAGGLVGGVAVYNHIMHTVTTTKLGLSAGPKPDTLSGLPAEGESNHGA